MKRTDRRTRIAGGGLGHTYAYERMWSSFGNGVGGASVVMFDEPVTLDGDFWLVNRGYAPLATTDFNMEYDEEPDSEHSFTSSDGIENLEPSTIGDYMLRAYVEPIQRIYATAGMARNSGANNTQWRSQYSVLNTGDDLVEAEALLVSSDGVTAAAGLVGPGQLVVWDDVISDLFGITDETTGSIVLDADGRERFRKYLPFKSFVNTIEDYPYPYIIGGTCWEFPCIVPSDWEAQNIQQPNNPQTVEDMKAALDAVVLKRPRQRPAAYRSQRDSPRLEPLARLRLRAVHEERIVTGR